MLTSTLNKLIKLIANLFDVKVCMNPTDTDIKHLRSNPQHCSSSLYLAPKGGIVIKRAKQGPDMWIYIATTIY